LVTQGHTKPQAAALATINNLFGFLGITLLTVTVALVSHTPLREAIKFPIPSWVFIVAGSVIVAAITISVVVKPIGAMVVKAKKSLVRDFKLIAANPVRLVFALLFSMLITVSYAAVLFVATKAMGESITVLQTFIVLIGGAEAGLVAGLSSVGIPTDVGLSIALVYRFATFWLPIIPGFIAFQIALRKKVL
jgi:undecaprenyl-diphosphatase